MLEIIAGIIIVLLVATMISFSIIDTIKESPKEFKKIISATADFLSFPFLVYLNFKSNLRSHKKRLTQIDALTGTPELDLALSRLLQEVQNARKTTETIESLHGLNNESSLTPGKTSNKAIVQK
ncbi:MAG: hypothetical protein KW793_04070 [Candidatus Doudnabacteria bacterium]|nr:hypothetical protein [Candidatus Doudnabacteria bacterium]